MVRAVLACLSLLCMIAAPGQAVPAADGDVFRVGIAPHTSARVILEQYQPVRQALEKGLGKPVEILTAPDFTEFVRRALAQDYDLVVTTGHQAQLLRVDAGYFPLMTYRADFRSVMVVPRDAAVKVPSDLAGGTVLGLNPSSLVTLWGVHWLKQNRVETKPMRFVSAADSVAQLLVAGEAVAGFISLANFQKLPQDLQDRLRIQEQSPPMAGRVYLLNRRLASSYEQVLEGLRTFSHSPEGLKYFQDNRLEGYRPITDGELRGMEPYAEEVRKVLRDSVP